MSFDTTALVASIASMASKIKDIAASAANAENSQKLEGLTLNQVVELIAGTTGITIQDVQDVIDAHIADTENPHAVTKAQVGLGSVEDYGVASNTEALSDIVADKYLTPSTLWHALNSFWSDQVGSAPETLDTINEIAAAITENADAVTSINDAIATRALASDLTDAIADLEGQIADVDKEDVGLGSVENYGIATEAQALETDVAVSSNEAYMTPLRVLAVRKAIEADVDAVVTSLTAAFDAATATLSAE